MQAAVFNNDAQGVSPALRTKSAMTDINLDRKMMSIRLKEVGALTTSSCEQKADLKKGPNDSEYSTR